MVGIIVWLQKRNLILLKLIGYNLSTLTKYIVEVISSGKFSDRKCLTCDNPGKTDLQLNPPHKID